METVQSVYFCFGAKPANSTFATKTAKKKVWTSSFFTLKLTEEAKSLTFFWNFKDGRRRQTPSTASNQKCILLTETECHIINYLLTELARAVPGNIGPRSFLYGPRCARSVLSQPRANIPQYGPRARLVRGYYFPKSLSIMNKKVFASTQPLFKAILQ